MHYYCVRVVKSQFYRKANMPNTLNSIDTMIGAPAGLRERLAKLYDIWDKSSTTVSEQEKTLVKFIEIAKANPKISEGQVKVFQGMLDDARDGKTSDLGELIEAVKATGTDPVEVFRKGLMKSMGDDKHPYTPAGIKSKADAKKAAADKKAAGSTIQAETETAQADLNIGKGKQSAFKK